VRTSLLAIRLPLRQLAVKPPFGVRLATSLRTPALPPARRRSLLDIPGDELMKEYEYDHGAAGERQRGPHRDAQAALRMIGLAS